MTMTCASATAITIAERLGHVDAAVIGDLEEAHRNGRSARWLWLQVGALLVLGAWRKLIDAPLDVVRTLGLGWVILVIAFAPADRVAGRLAEAVLGWDRGTAYATDVWWPFQVVATLLSYSGFVLSAWVVATLRRGGPVLLLHVASVFIALVVAAITVAVLSARWGYVPVPHPLFFFLHLTLPYQWRSGIVMVPLLMLVAGILGAGRRRHRAIA